MRGDSGARGGGTCVASVRVISAMAFAAPRTAASPAESLAMRSRARTAAQENPQWDALCGSAPDIHADDPSQVEGVAVWVHAELAPGVTLASTDCPSWTQLFYPIDRLPPERAEVRFTLDARPASVQWSVECGDVTHLHSPHLARAWWQAHAGR